MMVLYKGNMGYTFHRLDRYKTYARILLLVDEDGGHTHARANAHAGDEHLVAVLLGNVQASGDLPCAS